MTLLKQVDTRYVEATEEKSSNE